MWNIRGWLLDRLISKSAMQPSVAELLERIAELEAELQQFQARTLVWVDPTVKSYSAVYEPPQPRTDPRLQARLEQEAREKERNQKMKAILHLPPDTDSCELPSIPGEFSRKMRKLYPTGELPPLNLDT